MGMTTTGCFGKFALTRQISGWNDGLGNKFVKTIVFWGLLIVPVYEVCFAADYFVLNLIEFWTGSNLIADADVQHEILPDGSVQIAFNGKTWRLVPTPGEGFRLEREGKVIGHARILHDGNLELDAEKLGKVMLQAPDAEQIERISVLAARRAKGLGRSS
jgi:hypothetical protein